MADIGREEDASNVGAVGFEFRYWHQASDVSDCDQAPYVYSSVNAVADCRA